MTIVRYCSFLLSLFSLLAPVCSAQLQADDDPAKAVEVSELLYTPQSDGLKFTVVNRSSKPILAYGVTLIMNFPDGSTTRVVLSQDFVPTLALVGRVTGLRQGEIVGEWQTGVRLFWNLTTPHKSQAAVSVSVVPAFVLFADDTVIGENGDAVDRIFQEREASLEECAGYLAALRNIQSSSNIQAGLQALRSSLVRESKGERLFSWHSSTKPPLRCFLCSQFERELPGILRSLGSGEVKPEVVLSGYIRDVERHHAAYSTHYRPAGGKQR